MYKENKRLHRFLAETVHCALIFIPSTMCNACYYFQKHPLSNNSTEVQYLFCIQSYSQVFVYYFAVL